MPRPRFSFLAFLAGALATLALSACGGSGSPTNPSASGESGENSPVKFAKCMREHGIEANVSTGPGGSSALRITGHAGKGTPQQMEAAQKACARYQPKGGKAANLTPAERAQREDAVLAFAKCMRQHGIDVPNPETSGGRVGIEIQGGVDPNSPKFQEAQKACQGLLPKRGGGPGTQTSDGGPAGAGPATLSAGG